MFAGDLLTRNQASWQRLSELLDRADAKGLSDLDPEELDQLARLYRRAASHLAEARTVGAEERTTEYLNELVGRAYARVYAGGGRRQNIARFFAVEVPRTFRARWRYLAWALALSLIAAVIAFYAVTEDVRWASVFVGGSPVETWQGFAREAQPAGNYFADTAKSMGGGGFAGFLMSNNIRVALTAFALGITFCLGTLVVLITNSLMVGTFVGVGADGDALLRFVSIIAPHGVTELSAILVAGAAGLVIGWSLVDPGGLLRRDAVRLAALDAVKLALGTVPMFIVAGIIEGNVSPQTEGLFADDGPRILFGVAVGLAFWLYLLFGDRIWEREPRG